ncbi:cyclase family protein [Nocardiopsis rhodophaea]|uniref:cyclase family protein n=1 Tax=Nocardiopsis rhodophaea TaxID=280238 RepID=UPI0031DD220B
MTAPTPTDGKGTDSLLRAIAAGTTLYDLSQPLENSMPCSPNHPGFRMALIRRHGDAERPDGSSAASELIVTGGHVGTHIDALSHASLHGRMFGGHDAEEAQRGGRFTVHGIESVPPMVCRGVVLDIARQQGREVLEPGYGITADDLERATRATGHRPAEGDVCLVRTGWARLWNDADAYIGHAEGVPGLTESAARWIADHAVRAVGGDTTAVEQIPAGEGHRVLPVHRTLLVEHGIHLVEHLNLESLCAAGIGEFLFVLSPLKIVGATGSPVRPLAVVTRQDDGGEGTRR